MGRYGCNMTPVFLGSATFLFLKILIVAFKYVTQSKYINKTETKQKKRPMTHGTDHVS